MGEFTKPIDFPFYFIWARPKHIDNVSAYTVFMECKKFFPAYTQSMD